MAICPVCFWEDDLIQLKDPEYAGGANLVSLWQARLNEMLPYVRKSNLDEMKQ